MTHTLDKISKLDSIVRSNHDSDTNDALAASSLRDLSNDTLASTDSSVIPFEQLEDRPGGCVISCLVSPTESRLLYLVYSPSSLRRVLGSVIGYRPRNAVKKSFVEVGHMYMYVAEVNVFFLVSGVAIFVYHIFVPVAARLSPDVQVCSERSSCEVCTKHCLLFLFLVLYCAFIHRGFPP